MFHSSHQAFLIFALSLTAMAWPMQSNAGQLTLTWTDNSSDEDGFAVEREIGSAGTFTQVATVGPDVASYIDSGLDSATVYCYRVRAFNTVGDSAYSNEACGTTPQDFSLTVVRAGTGSGTDRKSTRLNSSHSRASRMPSSA